MIEISDKLDNKILIDEKEIKEVKEYFDTRYPSIKCIIRLYDGRTIESCMNYDIVKKLTISYDNHNLLKELRKHYLVEIDFDTGMPKADMKDILDLWDRVNKELKIITIDY